MENNMGNILLISYAERFKIASDKYIDTLELDEWIYKRYKTKDYRITTMGMESKYYFMICEVGDPM
jgi:hypothetical protein